MIGETQVPVYLRQCLDLLRPVQNKDEKDAPDRVEAALKALQVLLRSEGSQTQVKSHLRTLAEPLLKRLLHVRNQYNIENFEDMKHRAMTMLATQETAVSIRILTTAFYSKNYTIQVGFSVFAASSLSPYRRLYPITIAALTTLRTVS